MEVDKPNTKLLKLLLKDFTIKPTITLLAKELGMSRVGIWKILKKLEKEKLILLSALGAGKTSTYTINLNLDNPLLEKTLALFLTEDAIKNQRWLDNFKELENKVDFLIIYGSILYSKEASDIDLLGITKKNKFIEIESIIAKIQKTQFKKIHALNFTAAEFKQELEKPNKVFIDVIKKGVVLFGQEGFIKFIKGITRR